VDYFGGEFYADCLRREGFPFGFEEAVEEAGPICMVSLGEGHFFKAAYGVYGA
jgi:hypothetical protein